MSNPTYSRGGIAVALAVTFAVGFVVGGAAFQGVFGVLAGLQRWQAGLGAMIALFAACIAYANVQRQIGTQRALAVREEEEAAVVIRMELGELLDLLAVAWRIVDRAVANENDNSIWETRVTWARSDLAYHLPPIEVVEDIERLSDKTDVLTRRRLNKIIARLKIYFRESAKLDITPMSQENRVLRFGIHKLTLLRIQLSLIAQAVEEWDASEASRFAGLIRSPVDNRTWAQQLETLRQQAIEMETQ